MAADVCGLLLELDCGAHHVSFNCQQTAVSSAPPALYMLLHGFRPHLMLSMGWLFICHLVSHLTLQLPLSLAPAFHQKLPPLHQQN